MGGVVVKVAQNVLEEDSATLAEPDVRVGTPTLSDRRRPLIAGVGRIRWRRVRAIYRTRGPEIVDVQDHRPPAGVASQSLGELRVERLGCESFLTSAAEV